MITEKIRLLVNTSYNEIIIGNVSNIFPKLQLNTLTTYPVNISFDTTPGYIQWMDVTYFTETGTYYIYFTLGGSPPTEDALLIIEVVDTLEGETDSCVGSYQYQIDTITNSGGKAQINSLYNFAVMPKVNEYVYISDSNYQGYHRVYNAIPPATITLDVNYVGALTLSTSVNVFNTNTSICLVWLNREGGRSSMIFDQRKDYGLTAGEVKSFDNNTSIKYINRGKNFDNTTVYKSGISQDEILLIESLRTSIQVWEYDINTNSNKPIFVDSSSFNKFNTKNKFNEVSFKYRLATYKIIQSQ